MGMSPKLQPNLFVSSTYPKHWVILHSWVWYILQGTAYVCGTYMYYKVQPMFASST